MSPVWYFLKALMLAAAQEPETYNRSLELKP